jgi:hypothetical protein
MAQVEVQQIQPFDSSIQEEWIRVTEEQDLLGVGASKFDSNTWRVFVNVAEFIREEPLQSDLFERITEALAKTDGVETAYQEDREVWIVQGDVTGESLIQSCAVALNELEPNIRAAIDALLQSQ